LENGCSFRTDDLQLTLAACHNRTAKIHTASLQPTTIAREEKWN